MPYQFWIQISATKHPQVNWFMKQAISSNLFAKIAKVLNPIILNPSFPGAFQLGIFQRCFVTFSTLMTTLSWRCLSFPSSFLRSFSHSAFRLCPFTTLQYHPQNLLLSSAFGTSFGLTPPPLNSPYIFFWSKSNILFCLNCSIIYSYLLALGLFASILCFSSSITVFNPFIFTRYFH